MTTTTKEASMDLESLFDGYDLLPFQRELFAFAKTLRNMPTAFKTLSNEQLLWNVGVETIALGDDPAPSDLKFCRQKLQERLKRLDDAEEQYQWFSLEWTKKPMTQLKLNWYCGSLVIN